MTTYSDETIAYALSRGIRPDDLPLIVNGCSGGLSLLYWVFGSRTISCAECCNRHDIDYAKGGTPKDRKEADKRLRQCSGKKPSSPETAGDKWWKKALKHSWWGISYWWRVTRSWIIYGIVRVFGRFYWHTQD